MKLKYFMRGLGIGIIFGTLIMLAGYMTSGKYKYSDEKIIEEAKKLGMVMEERPIVEKDDKSEPADTTTNETTKATTGSTTESTTETTTEATTEATTETTTEATTETTTEAADDKDVEIEVTRGMNSTTVAKLLQEKGIIEDYNDFDRYLDANGYSMKIQVRKYKFNSNMSYEEIAKKLVEGAN